MDGGHASLMQTRKILNSYTFDASIHLENYVNSVSVDATEPERKMFALFNKLTLQFTDLSRIIEEDVSVLQNTARQTERVLLSELTYNADKLVEVSDAVDGVKLSFDLASEGAIRIGGKLSAAERERSHIDKSIELLGYIKIFQDTPTENFNNAVKATSTPQELRDCLPPGLQKKNWGTISEVLHDLKKILFELVSEDVKNAQNNIILVADRVELELLGEFENTIIDIISDRCEDLRKIEHAKELAEWLHLFNNGQAIQKRYIFTVVQHRIPNDSFFQSASFYGEQIQPTNGTSQSKAGVPSANSAMGWLFGSKANANVASPKVLSLGGAEDEFTDSDSDGMTPGQSTHYPLNKVASMDSTNGVSISGGGMSLMDHLSGLFGMINKVCQEQFSIIREVFPTHTIAKVTRMLIQRIFNDPAFGIQARVDSILCPAPPQPPLSLPDYLDALVIVREKLSALFLLLMECCSHPSMRGMGSESACLKKAKLPAQYGRTGRGRRDDASIAPETIGSRGNIFMDADEEAEEILHSDAEIRDFFDDLIGQVFSTYLSDYFAKESLHVRNQFSELLRAAVDELGALSKPASSGPIQLPFMRADRIKSVAAIVQSVGSKVFINRIFAITTDTVCRMESIGRDDKKLTHRLKDLFLLQLGFLCEGLFQPWARVCINTLLKQLLNRSATALPPAEVLLVLSLITYGVSKIKTHFEDVFLRPLTIVPNIVAVCKESRMKAFKELDLLARQMVYAWTLCAVAQVERILASLQSRYDYAPKFESSGAARLEPTAACDAVCKALQTVASFMRTFEPKILGMDLVKVFWRPLGQQVIGALISHLRKLRISPEGSKFLVRDIKEYSKNLSFVEVPDVTDMMSCLKELSNLFSTPADRVVKLIVEDLRYIDTTVVLALVRARSDAAAASRDPNLYPAHLSKLFPAHKAETPLSWENRKPLTPSSLVDAAMLGSKWTSTLGPISLRRSAGSGVSPVSTLFMTEVVRASALTPAQLTAHGRTVAVDLARIEADDDIDSIPVQALSLAGSSDSAGNRRSVNTNSGGGFSQFLPNRPDEQLAATTASPSQGGSHLSITAKSGGGIARPDHLLSGTGNTITSKARPHSTVIKSSAATLLSAGAANQDGTRNRHSVAHSVKSKSASADHSLLGSVEEGSPATQPPPQQQQKRLLNKMASFFQR